MCHTCGECTRAGDKPQAFVGSREWIGAIELGYVLDQLLQVQHKVITVASGAEMSSKAREIAQHFSTQGTPIMVPPSTVGPGWPPTIVTSDECMIE